MTPFAKLPDGDPLVASAGSHLGREIPVTFECDGTKLIGMLHAPSRPATAGVLIVVGGPQYRLGSHRQFLFLARALAAGGIAAFRFDCRGMGDSDGEFRGFEAIGPDIRAAVDTMLHAVPSIRSVMLWGLCDAASAICFYAQEDRRIGGAILLNPWVRTEVSEARAYLRHYYLQRIFDRAFWRHVLSRKFKPVEAGRSLFGNFARAVAAPGSSGERGQVALAERMAIDLEKYQGPVLLVLSGRDLTAKEFEDAVRGSERWRRILADRRVTCRALPEADHTFSKRVWREQIAAWTQGWVNQISISDQAGPS